MFSQLFFFAFLIALNSAVKCQNIRISGFRHRIKYNGVYTIQQGTVNEEHFWRTGHSPNYHYIGMGENQYWWFDDDLKDFHHPTEGQGDGVYGYFGTRTWYTSPVFTTSAAFEWHAPWGSGSWQPFQLKIECVGTIYVSDFEDVLIEGDDNLVFVGDFPELKLCEGSSNAGSGSSACCIVLGPNPDLKGPNCATTSPGRRVLSECPSGTFNAAEVCAESGVFCHEDGYGVDGCASCDLCDKCSACEPENVSESEENASGEDVDSGESDDGDVERRLLSVNTVVDIQPGTEVGHVVPPENSHVSIVTNACSGTNCKKTLKVTGKNNLVFIGHFPQLKMCEGSGNEGEGQSNCCVLVPNGSGQHTAFHGANCAATRARRALQACPYGTFDVRQTCEQYGEWCHATDGAIDGCLDCNQCPSFALCPSCAPDRRKN